MAEAATKAADPVTTEFPSSMGLTWIAGGTASPGPLDPISGVHASGTPANEVAAHAQVIANADGSVEMRALIGGAPEIPIGRLKIPQAQLAAVIAAMQAAPSKAADKGGEAHHKAEAHHK